jgi:pimeloyl-ACP methyl ester carboxylesterase
MSNLIRGLIVSVALAFSGAGAAAEGIQHLEANGTDIAYVDEGSGAPIVFIHGGLADLRTWDAIRPLVAAKHRYIALNLRYFGPGDWPDEGQKFTAETHVEDVAAFIRTLDAGPVHLVGWSFGSDVATGVALAHPELVATLIVYEPTLGGLIDAGPKGDAARAKQAEIFDPVVEALKTGDVEGGTKRSVEGVLDMKAGDFETLDPGFRTIFLDNARTLPLWLAMPGVPVTCNSLRQFDKPVLVIHSDAGQPLFDHIATAMAACLPNGKLVTMAEANHAGPAQHPDVMEEMIESIVSAQE